MRAIIRFTITEFIVIQTGQKGFFINPLLHHILQYLLYGFHKLCLLFFICTLCHDREKWLFDTIFISAVYVLADSQINQSLFDGCTGGRTEGIIQNL